MTIKEIREMTGLSQAKFSELYHIPKRTIENWEAGSRKPAPYILYMLEKLVNMDFPKE